MESPRGRVAVITGDSRSSGAAVLARRGRHEEALEIDDWLADNLDRSVSPYRGEPDDWRARIAVVLGEEDHVVRYFL